MQRWTAGSAGIYTLATCNMLVVYSLAVEHLDCLVFFVALPRFAISLPNLVTLYARSTVHVGRFFLLSVRVHNRNDSRVCLVKYGYFSRVLRVVQTVLGGSCRVPRTVQTVLEI